MSRGLRNKMYDYEVTPPKGAWEKIATALDDSSETGSFESKLYNLETTPPASAWEQIQVSLNAENKTTRLPQNKSYHIFRYVAAIAAIAIIVFGAIILTRNKSAKKETARKEIVAPTKNPATNVPVASAEVNNPISDDEKRDDAALEASKNTFAKNDLSSMARLTLIKKNYLSAPAHYIENISKDDAVFGDLHYSEIAQLSFENDNTTSDISERYITLMTPDGNLIRMSKKWADLACCVSGEEQNADCKDQLERWREKIACSSIAPSPGNFMDILDLISSLQDNN